MIGTHPLAARLRRAAVRTVPLRMGPLCPVPEQMFPYAGSPYKRRLVACTCFVIGLCLTGLGILVVYFFPSRAVDIIPAGIPLWACGILCLWIAIRYPTRYIQVTPQAITLKGYFQSVTMPWQGVLALIAEKHFILCFGGFVSAGVMYSLYSGRLKLSFSSHLPGSERLASLVSEATGLTWNPKPVCRSK